jgi:hypothetical protein
MNVEQEGPSEGAIIFSLLEKLNGDDESDAWIMQAVLAARSKE